MPTPWKQLLLVFVLALGGIDDAAAELGFDFGVESFRWREFDAGIQQLEETGPRYRVGATWRQALDPTQRDFLNLRGALYFGRIDYDGQACTFSGLCVPFKSTANYGGAVVEGTYTRHVGDGGGEIFGGGGVDRWRRDISGSGGVSGAIEDWSVYYLLAGAGAHWGGPTSRQYVQAGVKYPFYATNVPDLFSVTLEPKGRASLFARFGTDFISAGRRQLGLGIYYDSYRFAASDVKQVGTLLVHQPQSKQDVIGVYATVYLQ